MSPALQVCGLIAVAVLVVGCGGGEDAGGGETTYPRASEPGDAPPLAARPAGSVAPVGNMPEGLIFDRAAGLFAVGLRDPDLLAFVDPDTLRVERRVPLPDAPRHLTMSPTGTAVVVPSESADAVLEVTPEGGIVSSTPVGKHPHDAASAAGRIFAADEYSDQVSVLAGGREIATLAAPVQPGGIAAVDNRYLALIAVSQRVLQVYDGRSLKSLGRVAAGKGPTHIVAFGEYVFVADTEGERVREFRISPHPREVTSAAAPGAPYGIAVDPRRDRLWVTLTATNRLAEFAIAGGANAPRRIATYTTVRQPNSVEVDPRTGNVFVAGRLDGRIQRIVPKPGADR